MLCSTEKRKAMSESNQHFLNSMKHFFKDKQNYIGIVILLFAAFLLFGYPIELIPADTRVGNRELPIYSVNTPEKKVALSFDAAWDNEYTKSILEILDKYQIHVTFFLTGGWVESYPDDVKAIVAAGHDLGNHSENHKQMSTLTSSEIKDEITKVHTKVKELTGQDMYLFRPPYGDYDNAVIQTATSLNYFTIQWSVDSLDWKDYGVESIIDTILNNKELDNGAIILMHNGAKYTKAALETIILELQKEGYQIVPISELIYKDKFHMDQTGRQYKD